MNQATTVASSQMAILKDVVLFDFIIGGSTGEKTVEADDFIREVGKMLPRGSFSWVSKYRSEAKREILKVGVARRIHNRVRGYFVPLSEAAGLSSKMTDIKARFMKEKAEFLANLPRIVDEWANAPVNASSTNNGKSRADLIRQHAPKTDDMDRMLSFDISATGIQSTSFFGEDDALHAEVKGLVGQAALEIAEDVRKSWKGPAAGRTSSRVLGLIRRVRNKAEAMGVLSMKFSRLAEVCDKVLGAVPEGQNIEGVQFLMVSSLLSRCMKAENILSEDSVRFDPLDVESAAPAVTPGVQPPAANVPMQSQPDLAIGDTAPAFDESPQPSSPLPTAILPSAAEPVASTQDDTLELVL